jgi:hypothetical protein
MKRSVSLWVRAMLLSGTVLGVSAPAHALSVCPHPSTSVRGDGPYPDYAEAPLEPFLWARVCDQRSPTRSVASNLAVEAPSTMHPLEIPLALIEREETASAPQRYLSGKVTRAPQFSEPVYRIELSERMKPAATYQLVAYDRNAPDPEIHELRLSSFRARSDARHFDASVVEQWPGPAGYTSRQVELGTYDWTEHRLAMGPTNRVPPLFRIDTLAEASPLARPVLSDVLLPNREGNAFQGFECGCGHSFEEYVDTDKGIHWMRLTPLTPDGREGPVFWARVVDGKLEVFPDRELLWRAAGPWALQLAFPLSALVALVVWYVRSRRRSP